MTPLLLLFDCDQTLSGRTDSDKRGTMTFTIQRYDEVKAGVFCVSGDIDVALVPELRGALEGLVKSGVKNIVVDLADVTYADSSALGLLVWLDGRLRDLHGRIVLSGANRDITRILEISGLVSVTRGVSTAESVDDALAGFDHSRSALLLWFRELKMRADVEELAEVRESVCDLFAPLKMSDASLFDVKVALGEALANAVRHGSPGSDSSISIRVEAYDNRIVLIVRDSGCGFDGEHSCSDDLYAASGRGIMFMRALMDHVEFEPLQDGGTLVRLTKHRTAAEPV